MNMYTIYGIYIYIHDTYSYYIIYRFELIFKKGIYTILYKLTQIILTFYKLFELFLMNCVITVNQYSSQPF